MNSSDPASYLFQYGAVGIIAVVALLAVRVLFNRQEASHQRDIDRADAEHAENLRLNQLIQDRIIPSIVSSSRAITENAALLQAIKYSEDVSAEVTRRTEAAARRNVELVRGISDNDG